MKNSLQIHLDAAQELTAFSHAIKIARRRRKLTLADLAVRSGVSVATLHRLEKGDPSVAVGSVFQVLGVLNLVRGLSQFVSPENDVQSTLAEVRVMRRRGHARRGGRTFAESDLDF